MFLDPMMVVASIFVHFGDLVMRVIVSSSWDEARHMLGIFIEISLLGRLDSFLG